VVGVQRGQPKPVSQTEPLKLTFQTFPVQLLAYEPALDTLALLSSLEDSGNQLYTAAVKGGAFTSVGKPIPKLTAMSYSRSDHAVYYTVNSNNGYYSTVTVNAVSVKSGEPLGEPITLAGDNEENQLV
jgi:hypothetical protein